MNKNNVQIRSQKKTILEAMGVADSRLRDIFEKTKTSYLEAIKDDKNDVISKVYEKVFNVVKPRNMAESFALGKIITYLERMPDLSSMKIELKVGKKSWIEKLFG